MLGSKSLWFDEAFLLLESRKDIPDLLGGAAEGVHPPLFRLIMHFWSGLGQAEWVVRFPSVIFSLCSILLAYKIAVDLCGRRIALWTSLFMSISGFQIYYAQEVKMYSLYLMLSLFSAYFAIRLVHTGKKVNLAGYVVSGALSLYCQYASFFFLAGLNCAVLYILWKNRSVGLLRSWAISNFILVILFLPWGRVFFDHFARVQEYFWSPGITIKDIFVVFKDFIFGYYTRGLSLSQGVFIAAILVFSIINIVRDNARAAGKWLFCCILIPCLLTLIVSLLLRPVYMSRTLITVSVFFYMLLAYGMESLRKYRAVFVIFCLILAVFSAVSLKNYYLEEKFSASVGVVVKKPVAGLAAVIKTLYRPGDIIAVSHTSLIYPIFYYLPEPLHKNIFLVDSQESYSGQDKALYAITRTSHIGITDLAKLPVKIKGIWLICGSWQEGVVPVSEPLHEYLSRQELILKETSFSGLELYYLKHLTFSQRK